MIAKKIHHPARQLTKKMAPPPCSDQKLYKSEISRSTYHDAPVGQDGVARVVRGKRPVGARQECETKEESEEDDEEDDVGAQRAYHVDEADDGHSEEEETEAGVESSRL